MENPCGFPMQTGEHRHGINGLLKAQEQGKSQGGLSCYASSSDTRLVPQASYVGPVKEESSYGLKKSLKSPQLLAPDISPYPNIDNDAT